MRASGSELVWDLVFEIEFSSGMVMVVPVVFPLGYTIIILLGLVLNNSFGTWEGSLVVVSLGTLSGFIIDTGEGFLLYYHWDFQLDTHLNRLVISD